MFSITFLCPFNINNIVNTILINIIDSIIKFPTFFIIPSLQNNNL